MSHYYDLKTNQLLSLDSLIINLFSIARKRLHLKLNENFNPNLPSVKETLDMIKESEEEGKNRADLPVPEELILYREMIQDSLANEYNFEDDVLSYLISANKFWMLNQINNKLPKNQSELRDIIGQDNSLIVRARRYSETADSLLMSMAIGAIPTTDSGQELSRGCYFQASHLEEERLGRSNHLALLHYKLGNRFNRYFRLVSEAVEISYASNNRKPLLLLNESPSIDDLLDRLNETTDEKTRKEIIEEIKSKSK